MSRELPLSTAPVSLRQEDREEGDERERDVDEPEEERSEDDLVAEGESSKAEAISHVLGCAT